MGFEPTVHCYTHDFQSCPLGHYGTPPRQRQREGHHNTCIVRCEAPLVSGGESGIRTHGSLHYTAFREQLLKPLGHLSRAQYNISLDEPQGCGRVGDHVSGDFAAISCSILALAHVQWERETAMCGQAVQRERWQ